MSIVKTQGLSGKLKLNFLLHLLLNQILLNPTRLIFMNGDACQDWLKRLSLAIALPRKADDVFALSFYAWTRDTESTVSNVHNISRFVQLPWWNRKQEETFLFGEQLFRFEVYHIRYCKFIIYLFII